MNACLHYSISLAIFSAITGWLLIPYGILHVCTSSLLPVDIFYLYLGLSLSAPLKCKYLAPEPFKLPPGEYEQAGGWISCSGNLCGCTISFFSCKLQESLPQKGGRKKQHKYKPLYGLMLVMFMFILFIFLTTYHTVLTLLNFSTGNSEKEENHQK